MRPCSSRRTLIDAVDKHYITEETRLELDALAVAAIKEVTGLMEYLQSPEALRNARRARERRIASRQQRLSDRPPRRTISGQRVLTEPPNAQPPQPEPPNREPTNRAPRTEPEDEPSTRHEEA